MNVKLPGLCYVASYILLNLSAQQMETAGCLSVYLLHRLASHKDALQGGHLSDSVRVIRVKCGSKFGQE